MLQFALRDLNVRAALAGALLTAGMVISLGHVTAADAAPFPPGPTVAAYPPGPYVTESALEFNPQPDPPGADGIIIHDVRSRRPAKTQADGIIMPNAFPPGPSLDGVIIPG